MATIIVSHEVEDFASWKLHYEADTARREGAGLTEVAVGTDSSNSKMVYMIWEGNPAIVSQMLQDPELAEKMKEAGVVSKPEVVVVNT